MKITKRPWKTKSGETRTAWAVRYRDAEGKQRLKTFKTKREAELWAAQTKLDLDHGVHRPDRTSPTIRQVAEWWLNRKKAERHERSTLKSYELHVRLHILPAIAADDQPNAWVGELGDVRVSRLTRSMCDVFALYLLTASARTWNGKLIVGKLLSRKTLRSVLSSFKAIVKEAMRRELIRVNPAQDVSISKKDREKVPLKIGEQIPDRADVRAILLASIGMWLVLFKTAAFTGMRSSELRALEWTEVDLDRQEIGVKQRADYENEIGACKSKAAYRTVRIGDDLVKALGAWKLVCPLNPLGLVFPHDDGNVLPIRKMLYMLKTVQCSIGMTQANGDGKYTMHSLRHFYASMMIDAGEPPKQLQCLLGHSTLAMTMDTYGHLFRAGEDETARINKAVASVLDG